MFQAMRHPVWVTVLVLLCAPARPAAAADEIVGVGNFALKVPGSDIGVELIEYKDIDRTPQHPRFHDPGAANIALRVRDLNAILPRLQKNALMSRIPGRRSCNCGFETSRL
jgi:hypothetical protein